MPTITALVHTQNDGLRLGRCLEMLYACDDVVIIDHGSQDDTLRIARQYGALIVSAAASDRLPVRASWILCLDPCESVSEGLATSLYECKSGSTPMHADTTFSVLLREETADGWLDHPRAQTRLVPANWNRWQGRLPVQSESSQLLQGELLRFAFP